MPAFVFELGQQVALRFSGETGEVVGRAEYKSKTNCYLVVYKAADGRQVEDWWEEDHIVSA